MGRIMGPGFWPSVLLEAHSGRFNRRSPFVSLLTMPCDLQHCTPYARSGESSTIGSLERVLTATKSLKQAIQMRLHHRMSALVVTGLFGLLFSTNSYAIPAFSRQYGTPCSTCCCQRIGELHDRDRLRGKWPPQQVLDAGRQRILNRRCNLLRLERSARLL